MPFKAGGCCGGCNKRLDPYGDHALSCASCGLYARHNRLRDALGAECAAAGWAVILEAPLPGALQRPADILVSVPEDAAPLAVDVSVVHPLHLSSPSAEDTPGLFADKREQAKLSVGAAACKTAGWKLTPVCVETTGTWGPSAQRFVRGLVRRQSMKAGTEVADTARAIWGRLSASTAKGIAVMLVRAYPGLFEPPPPCGAALVPLSSPDAVIPAAQQGDDPMGSGDTPQLPRQGAAAMHS